MKGYQLTWLVFFFIFLLATVSVHGIPYHLNLFDTAGKVSILKSLWYPMQVWNIKSNAHPI